MPFLKFLADPYVGWVSQCHFRIWDDQAILDHDWPHDWPELWFQGSFALLLVLKPSHLPWNGMILSKTWLMLSAENIIQRAWRFISRAAYIQVRCSPTTMAWQEAYFNFRNKSENFSFFNLVFWDENYNFFFFSLMLRDKSIFLSVLNLRRKQKFLSLILGPRDDNVNQD